MRITITQLRILVEVAETGTMTGAARRLNYSVSTVSGHLSEMESETGVRMLRRSEGRYRPTRKGRHYVNAAARIIHEIEHLKKIDPDD